jgi:hypothetical protein
MKDATECQRSKSSSTKNQVYPAAGGKLRTKNLSP